jgi:hypothetical protein
MIGRYVKSSIWLVAVALVLAGCGDGSSDIYGKWDGILDVEFSAESMTLGGTAMAVDRYERKDDKVSVFLKSDPNIGLVFAFKSKNEICSVTGCFKRM